MNEALNRGPDPTARAGGGALSGTIIVVAVRRDIAGENLRRLVELVLQKVCYDSEGVGEMQF